MLDLSFPAPRPRAGLPPLLGLLSGLGLPFALTAAPERQRIASGEARPVTLARAATLEDAMAVAIAQAGEMPPEKETQPKPEEAADLVKHLTSRLNAFATENRGEGRVVLRRLNRVEYENTLRDLFAVNVEIREMLPEDTVAHGFDNVGSALNISPVLLERYLEAVDAVMSRDREHPGAERP